ncbi:LytR/AlgR family response regulator transcription factor [Aquisalinus flavus]|uniref:DNA-binding response regulator n=1 Tax=Aquisalinus flavus TaxID=1526572 RepID=A0A8J2Y6T9_9PROT|nr:LytTR family DNA-binding domain-containing protein [Aquisalinus flavus]MBD0426483.1 response regulator transcription factor [Aquisalinus flavus]GGD07579.1 DNA-binding response regulator [Aquisalinus flavus]
MLRTIVCDDELPALELATSLLKDTGAVEIVMSCQSIIDALEVINEGGIDLVVLDIEMPELGGVDASKHMRVDPKPLLVFATAHAEYAVDAFGVDAIDYLMKPLDPERVGKAVEKAVRLNSLIASTEMGNDKADSPQPERSGMLKVKDAGHVYFIPYEDVYSIEAAGDYSLIHTPSREYALRRTLRALEKQLPDDLFVRVHRSTIISARHVREVRLLAKGEALVTLTNGVAVKVSRSYRDAVHRLTGEA